GGRRGGEGGGWRTCRPAAGGWRVGCAPSPIFLRCKGRSRRRPARQNIEQNGLGKVRPRCPSLALRHHSRCPLLGRLLGAKRKWCNRSQFDAHPVPPDGELPRAPDHCGLMPANLITLVHLSMFSAMNLANSSGECGATATAPRSANRCLMFGSSTAALVCWLSVAMISGGVPLGTPKPIQPAAS